ncbi:MAG: TolC family protein [Cyanobacteria bacterium RUI128]|nr:TolC family protein [Cyanobacteria bacterium RUI128]
MKKILCAFLACVIMLMNGGGYALAANEMMTGQARLQAAPNAKTIELAFVFDGPSDKNAEVLQLFQKTITRSLLPDFKAVFPKDLVFTGDWTEKGARNVAEKALASRARMVVSLGYLSSEYYTEKKNKNKFVMTIDQYGLRDFGPKTFNPIAQNVIDLTTFKKLVPTMKKTAILMNVNYYNMNNKNWNAIIAKRLKEKNCDLNFVVIPVNNNIQASLSKIPNDVDSVFVTPLFNITKAQRKEVYQYINNRKLPSFSAVGQEDVDIGAMLGTSAADVDKKLAESTSFNIYGVLKGNAVKNEKIPFFDDKVIFFNSDTAESVGYVAPLRLLNNCIIITHKELPKYDLGKLLDTLDESNLDMARKKFLVNAARRSVASAYLRYLPTVRLDLGYQTYNSSYAESYAGVPTRAGAFTFGIDQILYSPDLVTNIIVKHKKLKFDKAEAVLTKANMEYQTGNLYIDTLMLENMIKVQQELVQESRENLAIARVRQKTGKCGYEEVLRWAGDVSESEKKLLSMQAEYKNAKIHINKLLFKDQKTDFAFAPLTAKDPAFFTSDLNIIDHVRNPKRLELFTENLIKQVIYLSPETTKLKAAIGMKKAEMSNYAQKFFMPNAKMSLEWTRVFDRHLPYESSAHNQLRGATASAQSTGAQAKSYATSAAQAAADPANAADIMAAAPGNAVQAGAQAFQNYYFNTPYLGLDKDSFRFFIGAQWKPIEGGHKIAEIARCKAELNELKAYLEEVNTEIEMQVRSVVNRAIAKYFMIEKSYKAMFAEAENYQMVKDRYLVGQASVTQLADAQNLYHKAKLDALNSQYEFFKELIWVQRGLLSVNWNHANPEVKGWINKIPILLPAEPDFQL